MDKVSLEQYTNSNPTYKEYLSFDMDNKDSKEHLDLESGESRKEFADDEVLANQTLSFDSNKELTSETKSAVSKLLASLTTSLTIIVGGVSITIGVLSSSHFKLESFEISYSSLVTSIKMDKEADKDSFAYIYNEEGYEVSYPLSYGKNDIFFEELIPNREYLFEIRSFEDESFKTYEQKKFKTLENFFIENLVVSFSSIELDFIMKEALSTTTFLALKDGDNIVSSYVLIEGINTIVFSELGMGEKYNLFVTNSLENISNLVIYESFEITTLA